jgi:lipid-A-disaccharide synthase
LKYYLIAGEASGDLHAANLLKALQHHDRTADFRYWGGDMMQQVGGVLVKHYRDLAFMGFIEVLFNLRTILRNIATCKSDILAYQPDVLILVDYPGFNMRIAKWAKTKNIRIVYYISPQIWAWHESRVHKIKATVDTMLCILPFETAFYAKYDYPVQYVGHPLLDALPSIATANKPKNTAPIIAILAGSRRQEISKMLGIMLSIVPHFPHCQFVVAGAPNIPKVFYDAILQNYAFANVALIENDTYTLLQKADAALVASGTATLEVALFKVPEVVCYKGNALSFWIAKHLVKIKYISLVNLIMDKLIVTELIQNKLTTENLVTELTNLLQPTYAATMQVEYNALHSALGNGGASDRAARAIIKSLSA